MKKYLLSLMIFLMSVWACAVTVDKVTVQATGVPSDAVKKHFRLQPGKLFNEKEYYKAKEELQSTRIFKDIEFLETKRKDGVDIHIKADGRSYVLPTVFGLSGNKHAFGASVSAGNVFGKGEDFFFSIGTSRDGFATHGQANWNNHSVDIAYTHLNFNQRLYEGGWMSAPGIFTTSDDKNKHNSTLLQDIHGIQDDFFISYRYSISSLWSISLAPEYEYYRYKDDMLDSGNHSHIAFGVRYADKVHPSMDMRGLDGMEKLEKKDMLRDLPHVITGKLAELTYTTGGRLTGSDYAIDKISLEGSYLWELKSRHLIALFAKGQKAFSAPFSSQIRSSDLLFGMGLYDREQRGKAGVSVGISLTYFLVRNRTGILSIAPFYEQAYITSGGNSYRPHSGVGATVVYRLWSIPLPISFNFTHNLNEGSHHIGCKVGGKF